MDRIYESASWVQSLLKSDTRDADCLTHPPCCAHSIICSTYAYTCSRVVGQRIAQLCLCYIMSHQISSLRRQHPKSRLLADSLSQTLVPEALKHFLRKLLLLAEEFWDSSEPSSPWAHKRACRPWQSISCMPFPNSWRWSCAELRKGACHSSNKWQVPTLGWQIIIWRV